MKSALEMQIKIMRYHNTPLKTANIKNSGIIKCWQYCGETGSLTHCWWEYKMMQALEKIVR